MENSSENSFINFLNVELLDKLSYKKNTPSGVIISFGNNIHKETSHDKYEIVSFPRIVLKLKNVIIIKVFNVAYLIQIILVKILYLIQLIFQKYTIFTQNQ